MLEWLGVNQIFWTIKLVTWAALLFFSFRLKLISMYPLVYGYIFVSMSFETAMPYAAEWIGVFSLTYSYVYFGASMCTLFLAGSVLLSIYSTLQPLSLRKDWYLGAGAAIIAALGFLDPKTVWPFFRIIDIAYTMLTYLGAMTVIRMIRHRRRVVLGWNLKMVLLALTIPACLHSLVIVAFTIDSSISYQSLTYWTKATAVAAWIILAVGMSEWSPPQRLDTGEALRNESGGQLGERETAVVSVERNGARSG